MKKKTSHFETMLNVLDDPERRLTQFEILGELEKIKQEPLSPEEAEKLEFEFFAFRFKENFDWSSWNKKLAWNTYYGPLVAGKISQELSGVFLKINDPIEEWTIFSDRNNITESMLTYWQVRMNSSKNPVLKARYAGLLWEFYGHIKKEKSSISLEATQIFIDTINDMGNNKNYQQEIKEREEIFRLQEAFKVAISIKDEKRILMITNTILNYEKNTVPEKVILALTISYDLFLTAKKYEKYISLEHKNGIVLRVETRLDDMIASLPEKYQGLFMIKELVIRLLSYYEEDKSSLKRIVDKYLSAIEQQTGIASSMQAKFLLSEAYSIIPKTKDLKKYCDDLMVKLQKAGSRIQEDMKTFQIKTSFSGAEMNKFLAEMTEGSFEESIQRLTFLFLELFSKKVIKESFEKTKGSYQHFPIVYTAEQGRIVAKEKPIHEINNETLIRPARDQLSFCSPWLEKAIAEIIKKHTTSKEKLIDYLYRAPVFKAQQRPLIETAIKAYLDKDVIVFLHVIIPQFEVTIRNLLEESPLLKVKKSEGFDWLLLGNLLSNENLVHHFNEDIVFYFKVLFTEQTGLNLRNNICHGLGDINQFTMATASLVLHAFLILSEIRVRQH